MQNIIKSDPTSYHINKIKKEIFVNPKIYLNFYHYSTLLTLITFNNFLWSRTLIAGRLDNSFIIIKVKK